MNDGLLELIAIDNLDLAILHAGGSGLCVTRCKSVTLTTRTPVPMQIDGEPCFMQPCRIEISHKSQGKMLARNKKATCKSPLSECSPKFLEERGGGGGEAGPSHPRRRRSRRRWRFWWQCCS